MTSLGFAGWRRLVLSLSVLAWLPARAAEMPATDAQQLGAPVFVGRAPAAVSFEMSRARLTLSYMTAAEMQSKVASLTGYLHPAFTAYADVLGRYDARTGLRTNDRPSLISVLFMQRISSAIAASVIEREVFLDDDERLVFPHTDLLRSPADDELSSLIDRLYLQWLGVSATAEVDAQLRLGFRRAEQVGDSVAAYEWLLGMLLRHGGLYYY